VVQFGYIVLFAAALPMASLFALVANMVEMRTGVHHNHGIGAEIPYL
jgi:hypothetical protein